MAARGGRFVCFVASHSSKFLRTSKPVNYKRSLVTLAGGINIRSNFQDACALPVNKFDLTSHGVLATTSALFSTAFQSQADELGEADEDTEASKENRWPSPISQVVKQTCTIFVGGFDLMCNEDEIASLFSEFGVIDRVTIPLKRKYEMDNENSSYKYAFVTFSNEASVEKALEKAFIETNDGKKLDVKPKSKKSNRELELEMTVIVDDLPINATINDVHNYFSGFGNIELINIVYNSSLNKDSNARKNYAYVIYSSGSDIEDLTKISHSINNETVNVKKSNPKNKTQRRDRSRKVMIEGVAEGTTVEDIKSYLSQYGDVKDVSILASKDASEFRGIAIVEFTNANEVVDVTALDKHSLKNNSILIRALGALY